jgi:hypothetical protein
MVLKMVMVHLMALKMRSWMVHLMEMEHLMALMMVMKYLMA